MPRQNWKPIKLRKSIRWVSTKNHALNLEYNRERKFYLAENPKCVAGPKRGMSPHRSDQVHHRRGRGKFLLEKSTWSAVCAGCHDHIHRNPKWAYANGLMGKR